MHRVLALMLIPALLATSGTPPVLHTHDYTEHDHPEHHHGLAAHEHHTPPAYPDDGRAHLQECDPGTHTVSVASVSAAVPQIAVVLADLRLPGLPAPDLPIWRPVAYTDVRVHGPPPRTQASPRAPPLITHA